MLVTLSLVSKNYRIKFGILFFTDRIVWPANFRRCWVEHCLDCNKDWSCCIADFGGRGIRDTLLAKAHRMDACEVGSK